MLVYRLRSLSSVVLLLSVMIIQRFLDSLFCQEKKWIQMFFFSNQLVLFRTHACWNFCRESWYLQGNNKKLLRCFGLNFILIDLSVLQSGVPAFTVPQPDEAMSVLDEKASELEVNDYIQNNLITRQMLSWIALWFVVVSFDL